MLRPSCSRWQSATTAPAGISGCPCRARRTNRMRIPDLPVCTQCPGVGAASGRAARDLGRTKWESPNRWVKCIRIDLGGSRRTRALRSSRRRAGRCRMMRDTGVGRALDRGNRPPGHPRSMCPRTRRAEVCRGRTSRPTEREGQRAVRRRSGAIHDNSRTCRKSRRG